MFLCAVAADERAWVGACRGGGPWGSPPGAPSSLHTFLCGSGELAAGQVRVAVGVRSREQS